MNITENCNNALDCNKISENEKLNLAKHNLHRNGIIINIHKSYSKHRNLIHKPIFVNTISLIVIIRCLVILFMIFNGNMDPLIFFYLGDWSAFIPGVQIQFNLMLLSVLVMSSSSQLVHYWYWRKGILFSWLKPFEMISGFVEPQCIGNISKKLHYFLIVHNIIMKI